MKFSQLLNSSALITLIESVSTITVSSTHSASAERCRESFKLSPVEHTLEFERGKNWQTCSGFNLAFQQDGNLVLYNRRGRAIWSVNPQRGGGYIRRSS